MESFCDAIRRDVGEVSWFVRILGRHNMLSCWRVACAWGVLLVHDACASLRRLSVDWQFVLCTGTCALCSMHPRRSDEGEFVSGWSLSVMQKGRCAGGFKSVLCAGFNVFCACVHFYLFVIRATSLNTRSTAARF